MIGFLALIFGFVALGEATGQREISVLAFALGALGFALAALGPPGPRGGHGGA